MKPLRDMGLEVEESILAAGDIEILGSGISGEPVLIGIEYKTWGDLLQSMRNGRLAEQLRKMRQSYQVGWLLIEGRVRQQKKYLEIWNGARWFEVPGRISYQEVTSRMATVAASGVQVWRTETQDESLKWIRAFYHWWTAGKFEDHLSLSDFYRPPYGDGVNPLEEPTYVYKLASIMPGLGSKRAQSVDSTFPSPRAMMNAELEDWEKIEGIGKKMATTLVDVSIGKIRR